MPVVPVTTSPATPTTIAALITLAQTSTSRRRHRSSSTPVNGPTSEYGSSSAANAAATA